MLSFGCLTWLTLDEKDIVDTFPFDKLNGDVGADHIIKILLGSVHKRIDNYNRL